MAEEKSRLEKKVKKYLLLKIIPKYSVDASDHEYVAVIAAEQKEINDFAGILNEITGDRHCYSELPQEFSSCEEYFVYLKGQEIEKKTFVGD